MKQYKIKVISGAPKDKVITGKYLTVYTRAKPENQKANVAVIKILSNYFGVPQTNMKILKGMRSKNKVIGVADDDI